MSTERQWVSAIPRGDLEPDDVTAVTIGTREYIVYDADDGLYASAPLCSHGRAHLVDGYFDGHVIECPLHQGCFDVRTGDARGLPATRPLRMFEVRVVDDIVEIRTT